MAIVKKYKAKVEQIINPLPDIYTVSFSSDKEFKYLPGQFLYLALDNYDGIGQWPESRCFSMQSNMNEAQIKITFAVKENKPPRTQSKRQEILSDLCGGKKINRQERKASAKKFLATFAVNSFNR